MTIIGTDINRTICDDLIQFLSRGNDAVTNAASVHPVAGSVVVRKIEQDFFQLFDLLLNLSCALPHPDGTP